MPAVNDFPLLADVEDIVWNKLDQPLGEPGTPPWRRRETVAAYNQSYQYIWGRICDLDKNWGVKFANVTVTNGSRAVDLSVACPDLRSIRHVVEVGASGDEVRVWHPGTVDDAGALDWTWIYQKDQKQLWLLRAPTSGATLRVAYNYIPPPLIHGYFRSAGSTSSQLDTYEPSLDDVVTGQTAYVYSGSGAGQSRAALTWDGDTKTMTHAAWTTIPAVGDKYTCKPLLPIGALQAFVYDACCNLADKHEDNRLSVWVGEREKHLDHFKLEVVRHESAGEVVVKDTLGFSRFDDPAWRW